MTPILDSPDLTLYVGDVRDCLAELPDESVHCVVTSPPYWGLRDYGVPGQLGLEPTPEAYVENMVAVFREVRRVLRRDGTCWLNIGDSYNNVPWGRRKTPANATQIENREMLSSLKPKDLCGIPWRLAFALQADGWYLRSEIIWAKPNPMPESVTDRPTKSHEQVFLLTKAPRYFFDSDAVRESAEYGRREVTGPPRAGRSASSSAMWRGVGDGKEAVDAGSRTVRGSDPSAGRNLRSVWEIATQPYPEAHFATYPEELVRRCVVAGTSERGCCPECGAPWERETETLTAREQAQPPNRPKHTQRGGPGGLGASGGGVTPITTTLGWRPTCDHDREPISCTVADPFLGSGTTALVAREHGRRAVGIELREEYARLALERNRQLTIWIAE